MLLYHYFDKKTGPFRNLSDLSEEEAKKLLLTIKAEKPETMCAKRQYSFYAIPDGTYLLIEGGKEELRGGSVPDQQRKHVTGLQSE